MKKLVLLIGFISVIYQVNAQEGSLEVSLNGQMQLTKGETFLSPSNDLKDKFKKGFGANLEGAYYLSDNFSFGLELGLNSIKKYTNSGMEYKPKVLSAMLKPRFYFSSGSVRPYGELGVGLARMKLDVTRTGGTGSGTEANGLKKNRVIVAPGLGVRVGLSDNVDINLGARYNFLKEYRHVQVMAGLAFRLN